MGNLCLKVLAGNLQYSMPPAVKEMQVSVLQKGFYVYIKTHVHQCTRLNKSKVQGSQNCSWHFGVPKDCFPAFSKIVGHIQTWLAITGKLIQCRHVELMGQICSHNH